MKKRRRPEARQAPTRKPLTTVTQLVQIEKPVYGGNFLARVEGKATFVPLVLPGEILKARLTEEKRGYSTAEMEEIVMAAVERIAPRCRHFGTCGGCQYQHTDYATQLALKKTILLETLQRGGVEVRDEIQLLAGSEADAWGYRNRIRLAIDANGRPGYRGRRSNSIVPIAECPIAAPLLVRAALTLAEAIKQDSSGLPIDEIALFCDADESALLIGVLAKSSNKDAFDEFARTMAERIPELKGMSLATASSDEADRGMPRVIKHSGDSYLNYRAAGFDYRVDNGAFFQINRRLLDALADMVAANRTGKLAWDLFAGVGLFARKLAVSFDRVVAVESSPLAIPGLKANLLGTSGAAVQSSALNFLLANAKNEKPTLIVVDPPRAGLGPEVTSALAGIGAAMITYVSCDPATLARDLRAMLSSGYKIERITLADLFPQTFHLETVVELRRA